MDQIAGITYFRIARYHMDHIIWLRGHPKLKQKLSEGDLSRGLIFSKILK